MVVRWKEHLDCTVIKTEVWLYVLTCCDWLQRGQFWSRLFPPSHSKVGCHSSASCLCKVPFAHCVTYCSFCTCNTRERTAGFKDLVCKVQSPFDSITNICRIKVVTDRSLAHSTDPLWAFLGSLTKTQFLPSWDQNQISLTLIQSNQVLYFFPERVITLSAISKPAA